MKYDSKKKTTDTAPNGGTDGACNTATEFDSANPKWVDHAFNKNGMAEAAAYQVAAMALGPFKREVADPRRLRTAVEAFCQPKTPAKEIDHTLTTKIAGNLLSVHPRQVIQLFKNGKLRGTRLGWKTYRIQESSVLELMAGKHDNQPTHTEGSANE